MKVLHCPEIVGGNAQQLAKVEREFGLNSKSIAFKQTQYAYPVDEILLQKNSGRLKLELARWKLLYKAFFFDVIHYNFGQSIMPMGIHFKDKIIASYPLFIRIFIHGYTHFVEMLDVRLLKFLNKKIVVTYQGDDIRRGDYCRNNFDITFATYVSDNYYTISSDLTKKRKVAKFNKYADQVYALNPDLLYLLDSRAKFLPYSHINLDDWKISTATPNKIPVVLHAPSNRNVKGTKFILDAVQNLRNKGLLFEFVLIEGMSNAEARRHYSRVDILVDQLLAGWYGGLAVELMALGKPVIAYIREQDLKFIPQEMADEMPIIHANPTNVEDVLESWITKEKSALSEWGLKCRSYVERWHDPRKIAMEVCRDGYGLILND